MKKIPTVFERDWSGDRSRVTPQVHAGCEWVLAGEGKATRKLDGTSCAVRDGKLHKRRELRKGETGPVDFDSIGYDEDTGKTVGWVPVGEGAEDRWHREAFADHPTQPPPDATYELIGPKVQGNPEGSPKHILVAHDDLSLVLDPEPPRDFDGLREWMAGQNVEGIVWHHPDGRMGKLKLRDFGLKRSDRHEQT